jgi:transposase-like protein
MNLQAPLMTPEVWGKGGYRSAAADAIKRILEERMGDFIDQVIETSVKDVDRDRRNGSYGRTLMTEVGEVFLEVPRTRTASAKKVLEAYGRRSKDIDRAVMMCFLLGLSTRKVADALVPMLGAKISATTVSRITKALDDTVKAFHRRKIPDIYIALIFDGVVLSRKTGAGALRRPVLTVLGLRDDGKKEVIDYRLANSESEAEWERFLRDLYDRGLCAANTKIAVLDGGKGLLAALPTVFPDVPIQRCWAHKMRNVTDKVRRLDRQHVKRALQKVYLAKDAVRARTAARRFADRFEHRYPDAVRCLRVDIDMLLTHFRFNDEHWRRWTRTTNAIERRFREVRRRTRPMGVFSDTTSIDRILFAVFTYENKQQGITPLFALTQSN